jgi:glycosyltransferase involved in cell wall biosynthesis
MIPEVRKLNPTADVRRIFHPLYDFYLKWDRDEETNIEPMLKLLFFGKIRRYKGLMTFLEALSHLVGKLDFKAVVAGEFYVDSAPYRKACQRWKLDSRVEWKDFYIPNEDVPELFRWADLVVLPYREATQSGVVPIAYQFEVPVIATDVGGLSEVVIHGETGYLVPPGDAAAIADRIAEFHGYGNRTDFQTRIRHFRERLTWNQVVETIIELTGT